MTCKDCIHYDLCKSAIMDSAIVRRMMLNGSVMLEEARQVMEEYYASCNHFKDRSKFIEQKHGFFLEDEDCYGKTVYQCSNCGMYFSLIEGTPEENEYDYCPSCGGNDELEQALKEHEKE